MLYLCICEFVQLSKSSRSKNGGAYFSAVCGSNLVPVSATEAHWHRVCDRLLGFFSRAHFFVSQKFAVLKAVQLAGSLFGNMVGKMRNTCEHQRVRRLRLRLRMSGAGAKLSKGLKGPEGLPQPSHSLVLTSISHLSNHISKE